MNWSEQLKVLLELQKIDGAVYRLEKEASEKPKERKSLEDAFESAKSRLKDSEKTLKDLQIKQKERENELLSKETNIKKYQTQQSQVKTNKEYSALTQEISGLKADCSVFEEEILKVMDQIESQKKAVEADRKTIAADEKVHKERLAELAAREDAVRAEVVKLNTDRQAYIPQVDKTLLREYERILKKREGVAITEIVGESCGGCHMSIRAQSVNEIRIGEKMVECEACGRIVYEPASKSA